MGRLSGGSSRGSVPRGAGGGSGWLLPGQRDGCGGSGVPLGLRSRGQLRVAVRRAGGSRIEGQPGELGLGSAAPVSGARGVAFPFAAGLPSRGLCTVRPGACSHPRPVSVRLPVPPPPPCVREHPGAPPGARRRPHPVSVCLTVSPPPPAPRVREPPGATARPVRCPTPRQ